MKVAVGQFASSADKTSNIERISALTLEAVKAGARLVVFPEGAMHTFGALTDDLAPAAEPLDGRFVDNLTRLTDRLGVTVVAGMFEAIPDDHRIYNTAVVVAPRDGLVARHRKRYLYDAFSEKESDRMVAGSDDLPIVEIDGFMTAVAICYELRFPAFIQDAADRGAELLALPAAWVAGPLKEDHWLVTVRSRAIENTMYVAAAAMTGVGYCARSMVVDPLGVVLSGLAEAEGVTIAEISKERLAQASAKLPLVAQRRVPSPVEK
ncbi:MAG TPA: carbon-nitrogen hydrolase family protein [Candidatus Sulfotelmatobacter sp.]|nr:carbon-nitrogen hydrolase family protein [Candidatus Sulfotelmatobacter sp.]